VAITRANANVYFSERNHTDAAIWAAYEENQQDAAIAEAVRFLSSQRMTPHYTGSGTTPIGQTDPLDTDTTDADDFPREDLATYELALWFLMFGNATHDGQLAGPKWIAERISTMRAEGAHKEQLAPGARRWLGWNTRGPMILRG